MSRQPLDYQSPAVHVTPWSESRKMAIGLGVGVGSVITPIALSLAMASGGGGHGDYGFARGLFPIPMCIAMYISGSITIPSIALAFVQFSMYGGIIGYASTLQRLVFASIAATLLITHLLAFLICS